MKFSYRKFKIYDKKNMLNLLKKFPQQCLEGYNLSMPEINRNFDKIVIAGMGGSAISGDIIKVLIEEFSEIPVFIIKDYSLPNYVNSKSLVIVATYSGNTEETISAYEKAKRKNAIIFCISSNGEIEKLSKIDKMPFIKIPSGIPPRCALGYLFFPLYKFFNIKNLLPPIEISFFKKIEEWTERFSPKNKNNLAIKIAERIYGKILVVYSENRFYPGILRWKTQIAENSKNLTFINLLPEMNHNEIMSFAYPKWAIKKCVALFISSGLENERIKKRISITTNIISKKIREVITLELEGDSLLEKLFYLIILGDWISYYLALINKVDPTEIEEIEILKDALKNKKEE